MRDTSPSDAPQADASQAEGPHPLIKPALEIGPLVVFFLVNGRYGIFAGTAAFMAATAVSLAASYRLERRLPVMPGITAIFVLIFGGLTLWLHNDLFIKIKPTLIDLLFAAILGGGMLAGRPLLKPLLGSVLPGLSDPGWRRLTWRWTVFFVLLAALNEILWRNFSTNFWVDAKLFLVMPLTLLFSFVQIPLIRRYTEEEPAEKEPAGAAQP